MADFVQTMKDWRRMCKFCSDKGIEYGQHGCVNICQLGHNSACGDIEKATDKDIEDAAKAIEQWSIEHPTITWKEWFVSNGLAVFDTVADCPDWGATLRCQIPAAIIEKLRKRPNKPVYLTWFEWLENMGIVAKEKREYSQIYDAVLPTTRMFDPIPADIAQKLGIEPKEG